MGEGDLLDSGVPSDLPSLQQPVFLKQIFYSHTRRHSNNQITSGQRGKTGDYSALDQSVGCSIQRPVGGEVTLELGFNLGVLRLLAHRLTESVALNPAEYSSDRPIRHGSTHGSQGIGHRSQDQALAGTRDDLRRVARELVGPLSLFELENFH